MVGGCAGLLGAALFGAEDNPAWKTSKFGIFIHHAWGGSARELTRNADLSIPKSIDEITDVYDIQLLVKDLQSFNSEYVVFTCWHAQMNPIFPSAAMDKWRGQGHCARRDVIGELIKELKPTGIKLLLYVHPSAGHVTPRYPLRSPGRSRAKSIRNSERTPAPTRHRGPATWAAEC